MCGSQTPQNTTHLWSPDPALPLVSPFSFSVCFLLITAHPASAVSAPPRLLSVFLSAVLLVFRHISPFVGPLLILLPLRLFHFPASSFEADSDELEGQASPPFFVD